MIYAFKVLFKSPKDLLKNYKGRRFLMYCAELGHKSRNQCVRTSLIGDPFELVDTWSFLWQYHEIFVKESYCFHTANQKPLIVDCGSNIGTSIKYYTQKFPEATIHGFEPDPDVFEVLQKNIGHLPNVNVQKKAVWIHDEKVRLSSDGIDGGRIDEGQKGEIESIRLRDFLAQFDEIDFLKIDIEGAEFKVIEDCSEVLCRVKSLFLEVHTFQGQPQYVSTILKVLENSGFRYYIENENDQKKPLLGNWKLTPSGIDVQLNIFAVRD